MIQGTGQLWPYQSGWALFGCLFLFLFNYSSLESHLYIWLFALQALLLCAVDSDFKRNPDIVKIFKETKRGAKRHTEFAVGWGTVVGLLPFPGQKGAEPCSRWEPE